jgi:hypothetical protein
VLLRGKEAEEVKGWAELSEMRVVVSDARWGEIENTVVPWIYS